MNNWRMGLRAHIAIAVLCFGTIAHTSAQKPRTGQISGHVVDIAGAAIEGASVFTIRRNMPPDENVRLMTHTDIHGDFTLVLPEGGYDVLVISPSFEASVKTVSALAQKTSKIQWKLQVLDCNFPGVNCDTFQ